MKPERFRIRLIGIPLYPCENAASVRASLTKCLVVGSIVRKAMGDYFTN